jgi:hypothetical protein
MYAEMRNKLLVFSMYDWRTELLESILILDRRQRGDYARPSFVGKLWREKIYFSNYFLFYEL